MQPDKIIPLPLSSPDTTYLAALPMAVVILGAQQNIRFLNSAGEMMLGISAPQAVGKALAELFHPEAALLPLVKRVFDEQAVLRDHEHQLQPQRATAQRVNLLLVPVKGEGGREVILFLDAPAAMHAMTDQATQRGVAKAAGTIAAMLAHEVKNPLSGIRGAAQLLAEDRAPEERALADLICREVERIRQLLDQFETLSDNGAEEASAINIHAALDDACTLVQNAQKLKIDKLYDPSLPPVMAKNERLVQVFLNLLKNAGEAVQGVSTPRIAVSTSYKGGMRTRLAGGEMARAFVCVTVEDNGCGIDESLRETLFQPFVSTKEGSRGLGLAIAYKIINDFGGTLDLESTQPGCTRLRVMLPCEG